MAVKRAGPPRADLLTTTSGHKQLDGLRQEPPTRAAEEHGNLDRHFPYIKFPHPCPTEERQLHLGYAASYLQPPRATDFSFGLLATRCRLHRIWCVAVQICPRPPSDNAGEVRYIRHIVLPSVRIFYPWPLAAAGGACPDGGAKQKRYEGGEGGGGHLG